MPIPKVAPPKITGTILRRRTDTGANAGGTRFVEVHPRQPFLYQPSPIFAHEESWRLDVNQNPGTVPVFTRMGAHFTLYDFLFNDSVLRRTRIPNVPRIPSDNSYDVPSSILDMAAMADFLYEVLGPVSVSYGYITPELSEKIVRWKNPKLPSLHRWDDGCAADFIFHEQYGWRVAKRYARVRGLIGVSQPRFTTPTGTPARIMQAINASGIPLERAITYSESEAICLSVPLRDRAPRGKLYMNVYSGVRKAKPLYLSGKIGNAGTEDLLGRAQAAETALTDSGQSWRGQGWPSYHGHGKRQSHHIRLHPLVLLSDIIRHPDILKGAPDFPSADGRVVASLKAVGFNLGRLLSAYYLQDTAEMTCEAFGRDLRLLPEDKTDIVDYYAAAPKVNLSEPRVPRLSIVACYGVGSYMGSARARFIGETIPTALLKDVDPYGRGKFMVAILMTGSGYVGPVSFSHGRRWLLAYLESVGARIAALNGVGGRYPMMAVRVPTTVVPGAWPR